MRKILLLTTICLLATLSAATVRTAASSLAGTPFTKIEAPTPVLQINTSIKEAKRGSVLLEINWHIEQENLAVRPSTASIIAILIGARSKEYKVLSNVSIEPNGPLSGTTRVVINHEEQIVSPRDLRFVITVALKRDGHAGSLPSRTKEFLLRVEPKE